MKTSWTGIVLAAILVIVVGVGLGIAQAAGDQQEFVPEGNYSGTDWQASGPIETGSMSEPSQGEQLQQVSGPIETGIVPAQSDVNDFDHSDLPLEGNTHQYWMLNYGR